MESGPFDVQDLPNTFTENDWIPVAMVPALPVALDGFVMRNLMPMGVEIWDNQIQLWGVRDLDTRRIWLWPRREQDAGNSFFGVWGEDEIGVGATVGNLQVTWNGVPPE